MYLEARQVSRASFPTMVVTCGAVCNPNGTSRRKRKHVYNGIPTEKIVGCLVAT